MKREKITTFDDLKKRLAQTDAGCLEYSMAKKANGYGWLTHQGRQMSAHRLAWALCNGDIPEGKVVLHKCGNRACCNPDHLFIGVRTEEVMDRTGSRTGRLTVVQLSHIDREAYWLCRCDCGEFITVRGGNLQSNNTTSCGCYGYEQRIAANITHGMTDTKTYQSWMNMRSRCNDPENKAYRHYGGRGITVCERWSESFENFLADMGECPAGLSIERVDNDKGYSKENCIWATMKEQARNRRLTLRHEGEPLAAIAERLGENYMIVYSRFKKYGTPYKEAA